MKRSVSSVFSLTVLLVYFFLAYTATAANVPSSVTVNIVPNAPTNLSAVAADYYLINLSWTNNAPPTENGFSVERKTGLGGAYAHLATTSSGVAVYDDSSGSGNTSYFYRVRAFIGTDFSGYSNEASATTPIKCGNGIAETGEQCDGADLGGQTCQSQGYSAGSLSCTASCTFNTSSCVANPTPSSGGGGGGTYYFPPMELTKTKHRSALPPATLFLVDFNNDGKIDLSDISILLYYMNRPYPDGRARYDLNHDGKIDIVDVSILLYYWDK